MKKVAFVTIHGMGKVDQDYASDVQNRVKRILGPTLSDQVSMQSIFFSEPLQARESECFAKMQENHKLKYKLLREFCLYGLADCVALESKTTDKSSDYYVAQTSVAQTLLASARDLESLRRPVVLLALSLGCQVISNYIWDAQSSSVVDRKTTIPGVWSDIPALQTTLQANDAEMEFIKLNNLSDLITTGCNIPVFVAALAKHKVVPFTKPNADFRWDNYFDADDPLGYPLGPLSEEYDKLVTDHPVNVGGPLTSWTPLSHNKYWGDSDILEQVSTKLRAGIFAPNL